jgi:hypothetical protein
MAKEAHPHVAMLRTIYADLRRIAEYCDPAVVLHPADRSYTSAESTVVGKDAVLAKELELIRITDDSLNMDVQEIIANDAFGAVTGTLRAEKAGRSFAMPFCGLWRFRNARIVEHWENAYDVSAFGRFLAGS